MKRPSRLTPSWGCPKTSTSNLCLFHEMNIQGREVSAPGDHIVSFSVKSGVLQKTCLYKCHFLQAHVTIENVALQSYIKLQSLSCLHVITLLEREDKILKLQTSFNLFHFENLLKQTSFNLLTFSLFFQSHMTYSGLLLC